jgi:hypothetical protein
MARQAASRHSQRFAGSTPRFRVNRICGWESHFISVQLNTGLAVIAIIAFDMKIQR